ncbi:MAG TPA: hypothetical protein VFV33_21930 [Gemmatimonadaceae bacterium]|nr:hypothetical protein [Gemmatimonadaceae bacterium]
MDWADEHWVKLYRRDTTDWLALSLGARGLFCLILRAVNRAGVLDLGKTGPRAVAVHLRGSWAEVEPLLSELTADGCVRIVGASLVVPNFLAAQETPQSDKARASEHRARRRDVAMGESVTKRDGTDTKRDASVTRGHDVSRAVTKRREETRPEEKRENTHTRGREAPGDADTLVDTLSRASKGAVSSVATLEHQQALACTLADLGVVGAAEVERFGAALADGGMKRYAPWLKVDRVTCAYLLRDGARTLTELVDRWRDPTPAVSPSVDLSDPWEIAKARYESEERERIAKAREARKAAGGAS